MEEIVTDERRHVRKSRRIEARACAEHVVRFTRFAPQQDLLQIGLLERLGWTALAAPALPPQPA